MPVRSFRVKSTGRRMRVQPSKKVPEATKNYVQKAIKSAPETKFSTYSDENNRGATNIPYDSPVLFFLSRADENVSAAFGRDGDRIMPININVRLRLNMQDVTAVARIIMFQWKPNNNEDAPTATKILDVATLDADSVDYQLTNKKADRAKFKVLHDRRYTYQNSQMVLDVINKTTKDFANKYIHYDDAGDKGKNHIYLLAFSNRTAAETEPVIYIDQVFKWKDM